MGWRRRPWREQRREADEPGFARGGSGESRYIGPPAQSGYGPYWRGEPGRDLERFTDLPDPSRGIRSEGPGGFFWEGLGFGTPSDLRGRGPKGYRRSDARIADEVCERLTVDSHVDATHVEVTVRDGVVYLRGKVADRAQKRRAEWIAEQARGVFDVMNELELMRESPSGAAGPSVSEGTRQR